MKLLHAFTANAAVELPRGTGSGRQAFHCIAVHGSSLGGGSLALEHGLGVDDDASWEPLEGYTAIPLGATRKVQWPGRLRLSLTGATAPSFSVYHEIGD